MIDVRTTLHRWSINTAKGTVVEATLDDRSVEFPVVDPRRVGLPHRYGYAVEYWREGAAAAGSAVVKYDLAGQSTTHHDFGPGRTPDELVFVPADRRRGRRGLPHRLRLRRQP